MVVAVEGTRARCLRLHARTNVFMGASDSTTTPGATPLERYGMTETGMILGNPLCGERRVGTVGLPFPALGVRLVDQDNKGVGVPLCGGPLGARSLLTEGMAAPARFCCCRMALRLLPGSRKPCARCIAWAGVMGEHVLWAIHSDPPPLPRPIQLGRRAKSA